MFRLSPRAFRVTAPPVGPLPSPRGKSARAEGGPRPRHVATCIADARLGTACLCNQQASCQPPLLRATAAPSVPTGTGGDPQTLRDVVAWDFEGNEDRRLLSLMVPGRAHESDFGLDPRQRHCAQ